MYIYIYIYIVYMLFYQSFCKENIYIVRVCLCVCLCVRICGWVGVTKVTIKVHTSLDYQGSASCSSTNCQCNPAELNKF